MCLYLRGAVVLAHSWRVHWASGLLPQTEPAVQDIKLFINSPGGSVTAGMGIYDAMQVPFKRRGLHSLPQPDKLAEAECILS